MNRVSRRASLFTVGALGVPLLALVVTPAWPQTPQAPHPTYTRLARAGSPMDTTNAIVDYGRSIRSLFDTAGGAVDQQRLTIGDCDTTGPCSVGPLATIQPRLRRPNWDKPPRDSGEVIARIISNAPYVRIRGSDTTYKFNIHGRDTVFWWVGPREGRLVSVFASTQPGVAPLVSRLELGPHDRTYWKQGLARWVWTTHDEWAWGTCDGGRCCLSDGLELFR